jgi:hypothetical protein
VQHGGGSLLVKYGDSLLNVLAGVYPEYLWDATVKRRQQHPHSYWSSSSQVHQQFLDSFAEKHGFTKHEDWYHCHLMS